MDDRRRGKPRQTSYLYKCRACGGISNRGSNAKRCDLEPCAWNPGFTCGGLLDRLKTVKRPIKATLKIAR